MVESSVLVVPVTEQADKNVRSISQTDEGMDLPVMVLVHVVLLQAVAVVGM